ncbi:MAG TPA: hypothetical protein DD434_00440 [Bacteroidales bacterium]|nr:hypothetical protein [Bacteroidales bacterium]
MKSIKKILIALLVVAAILFGFYTYFGGFNKLNFKIEKAGGETIVYKQLVGDYSKSGEIMESISDELQNDHGLKITQNIGIYYDNPEDTDKDKLRADVGCVIKTHDQNKLDELQKNYSLKQIPEKEYLITKIPYKGYFSIIIGIFKVYPAMEKYLDKNNLSDDGPITEIYDKQNKEIIYRKEIIAERDDD